MMSPRLRLLYPLLIALVLAAVTFAYAAANSVPASYAGDGYNTISGYAVNNVHYVLDSTNPANISQVTFTLDQPASDVRIQLVTGGTWFTCTTSGTSVTCNVSGVTAAAANTLRVVAAQ